MTSGVADTTVVIHLFRKNQLAINWLQSRTDQVSVTPITWLEMFYGAPGKSGMVSCRTILEQFSMVHLTSADMEWAIQQMERYRLSHGISINDTLIASVCYRLQLPLFTHNTRHFNVMLPPEMVLRPY